MAEGYWNNHVTTIAVQQSTGEIQPNSGTSVYINYTVPSGKKAIMAVAKETTGANLFPVWLTYFNNSEAAVKVANFRTSAYTGTIELNILCQ